MPDGQDQALPPEAFASSLRQVVGALIFSSPVPLGADAIRKCLREMPADDAGRPAPYRDVLPRDVMSAILDIQQDLDRLGLGIALQEVAGGYRFQTQAGCGRWVRALLKKDKPALLSRPALETLAIIAYRQPVAKSEIEGIRGVTVDHVLRPLMEMHLVRIVGRSDLPGRPFLYGTTPLFLEHFGLRDLDELKDIDPTLKRDRKTDDEDLFTDKTPDGNTKSGGTGGSSVQNGQDASSPDVPEQKDQ